MPSSPLGKLDPDRMEWYIIHVRQMPGVQGTTRMTDQSYYSLPIIANYRIKYHTMNLQHPRTSASIYLP